MNPADTTDYYVLCQNGVMGLLRSLPFFATKPDIQVTDNRFNINKGFEYWAVFVPVSTFTASKIDPRNKRFVWSVVFDLYVRYKTAAEAPSKFQEVRGQIINFIHANPTLAGTRGVEDAIVSARGELLQDVPGDDPNFMIQTMLVSVAQRVTVKL